MPKQEQPQEPDKFTASKNPRKLGDSAAFGEMLARVRATKTASVRTFADSPPGPASVNALAAALQNNVDLIYEWVYNNVDYSPIYGSWKGDLGTLIDRSGGTVDQANLFWSLLTQADINNPTAGYNPQFVFGTANFTASQLENLLGTTDSAAAYPNTPSYNLLMQGIFGPEPSFVTLNTVKPYYDGSNNLTSIDIENYLWVEVTIGGTQYYFDPSFKTYSYTSGIGTSNIGAHSGFSLSGLNSTATESPFSSTSDSIQNLNVSGIRAQLTTYGTNLLDWINANEFAASMDEIIGGREIVPLTAPVRHVTPPGWKSGTTLTSYSSLPYTVPSSDGDGTYYVRPMLSFECPSAGISPLSYPCDEFYGNRFTITFNGAVEPVFMFNGYPLVTGSAQSADNYIQVNLVVYGALESSTGYTLQDYWSQEVRCNGTYFIGLGFGRSSQSMADYHQTILQQNLAAGGASTDEDVLGESLASLFFQHRAQNSAFTAIVEQLANVRTFVYQYSGGVFYNDLSNSPAFDIEGAYFFNWSTVDASTTLSYQADVLLSLAGSGFEGGILQQNLPITGLSVGRIFETANSASQPIYMADSSNWSSIESILASNNWSSSQLSDLNTLISQGFDLIVNQNGQTSNGSYIGNGLYGWLPVIPGSTLQPSTIDLLGTPLNPISGGFCNYSVDTATTASNVSNASTTTRVENALSPQTTDPINLYTGAALYSRTDISVGSQNFPYQLSFTRSYSSDTQYVNGPLGYGWTHNFATSIRTSSNGLRGCGEVSPKEAVAAIMAVYTALQLSLDQGPAVVTSGFPTGLVNYLIASSSIMWFIDSITNNAAVLSDGADSVTFVRLVDGSFNPPPAHAETLTLSGTYLLTNPQQKKWTFNSSGNVASYSDPAGVTVNYTYSGGNLVSVSNGLGRQFNFSYTSGYLTSVSDLNGRTITFNFSGGNLTQFTDTLLNSITYAYSAQGQLSQVFLPANPTVPVMTNTYDFLGRVASQSGSNTGTSNYYFAGSRSEEVDPLGNSHARYFNSLGSIVRDINALGQETDYAFDGLNRVTSITYPEQNSLQITYDNNNNILSQTQVAKPASGLSNIVQLFTYDPTWNKIASFQDGVGNVTSYSYTPTTGTSPGSLLTITRPIISGATPTVSFTYSSRGQVLTRTDETGIVDSFTYASGNETMLTSIHDFGSGRLNLEFKFGYDAVGNTNSITDPNGNVAIPNYATNFTFDSERRLTQRTECSPFNYVTTFGYDANNNRTSVSRQTGSLELPYQTWTYSYQYNNMVATVYDPENNELSYVYDTNNNLSSTTDAQGREWQYSYDELYRLITVTDPLSHTAQTRTYTTNGYLASIKDAASNITTLAYDGFDRLSVRTYPDGSKEQYTSYNANNQVLTMLTRNVDIITNTYDVLTRLSTRQPGSVLGLQTTTYDLAGRTLGISTPVVSGDPSTGAFQFSYDTAGRLLVQTMPNSKTVTYQLDANGNRTQLIWPDTVYAVYAYDNLNRLTGITYNGTNIGVGFSYDQLSRRTGINYYYSSPTVPVATTTYEYALNNDLTSLDHIFSASSVSFNYSHNKVHQLTSLSVNDNSFLWKPSASSTVNYVITSGSSNQELNQYSSVEGTSYGYNTNGCLTSGLVSATYDALSRPTQIVNGASTNNYLTDPLNRQAQKNANGTKTDFLYDNNQLIATYNDSSGALINRYIPGDNLDEVFFYINGSSTTFLHRDRQGSVIAESNSSGANINKYAYSPWGESSSISASSFGYTGQRYDSEVGLYNYKARYYEPIIGRFLQPDPIGYAAGDMNLYSYVGNDATNASDPLGLEAGLGGSNNRNWFDKWLFPDANASPPGANFPPPATGLPNPNQVFMNTLTINQEWWNPFHTIVTVNYYGTSTSTGFVPTNAPNANAYWAPGQLQSENPPGPGTPHSQIVSFPINQAGYQAVGLVSDVYTVTKPSWTVYGLAGPLAGPNCQDFALQAAAAAFVASNLPSNLPGVPISTADAISLGRTLYDQYNNLRPALRWPF